MSTEVVVSIITASASIMIAATSYWLTKHAERVSALRSRRLKQYEEILSAMGDTVIEDLNTHDAQIRLSKAFNLIGLSASPRVLQSLYDFHDCINVNAPNREERIQRHDELLTKLMNAIREDLGVKSGSFPLGFQFRFIGQRKRNN